MTTETKPLALGVLSAPLSIVRLPAEAVLPPWVEAGSWYSVARTGEELSVVCESRLVPADARQNGPWRALKVDGPLDFSLTGVLARIAAPIAKSEISIFAVSTFDTDYVLVPEIDLPAAVSSLRRSGMVVRGSD